MLIATLIRRRRDRRLWQGAKSLADLGELTARWLEGTLTYHPGYYGGPHRETAGLVPVLATLNRAGFVTTSSQPGYGARPGFDGAAWAQRPAVEGLADPCTAARLCAAAIGAGLHVVTAPAMAGEESTAGKAIPVTTRDGHTHTVFGPVAYTHLREQFFDCRVPALDKPLLAAWQVTIADLRWRESDLLWRTLADAVDTTRRPAQAAHLAAGT